jgi:hypothetical protein
VYNILDSELQSKIKMVIVTNINLLFNS